MPWRRTSPCAWHLFHRYGKLYPEVDLSVTSDTTGVLIAAVLDYKVEGAFVVGPLSHPLLTARTVFEEELVLYAPAGVRDVFPFIKTRTPRVLVFRAGCSYRERIQRLFSGWGMAHARLLEFSSLDGIFGCVSAGLGITVLPRGISEQPLWRARWNKSISIHALAKKDAIVPTLFVRRSDAYLSLSMARLIDLLPAPQRTSKSEQTRAEL